MGKQARHALRGRAIQQMLIDLNRVVERAGSMLTKAQNTGDNGYYDAVALNLHGFNSGVKQIFENDIRTSYRNKYDSPPAVRMPKDKTESAPIVQPPLFEWQISFVYV